MSSIQFMCIPYLHINNALLIKTAHKNGILMQLHYHIKISCACEVI